MELYQVTSAYYDEDHEHGYYDAGLWSTAKKAREAARELAEYRSAGEWHWKADSMGRFRIIACTADPYRTTYIQITAVNVDEPLPTDLSKTLVITYT